MRVLKRTRFLLDLAEELYWLKDKAGAEVSERWYPNWLWLNFAYWFQMNCLRNITERIEIFELAHWEPPRE